MSYLFFNILHNKKLRKLISELVFVIVKNLCSNFNARSHCCCKCCRFNVGSFCCCWASFIDCCQDNFKVFCQFFFSKAYFSNDNVDIVCFVKTIFNFTSFNIADCFLTSIVTVPLFGFGIRPLGPRILAIRPTKPIMSGVVIHTSKSTQFSFWIFQSCLLLQQNLRLLLELLLLFRLLRLPKL